MSNHWLSLTPKQFIDTFIPDKSSSSDNELRIRIFVTTAPNRIQSTTGFRIPTFVASGTTKRLLSHVMTGIMAVTLHINTYQDSFQITDFAFDRPVFDANKLEVAVIASCSQIPERISTLTFEELRLWGAMMNDLSQEFVNDVVDRLESPCPRPALDAVQRRAVMMRQLSAVVSAKEMTGDLRNGHVILVLRFNDELVLMQAEAEKFQKWEADGVGSFLLYQGLGLGGWADWVGTIASGQIIRCLQLISAEHWDTLSVFADDGRILVSWSIFTDQQVRQWPGQKPSLEEVPLVDWLVE